MRWWKLSTLLLLSTSMLPSLVSAQASMRSRYDAAAAAGPNADGSWYRDSNNASGTLAWGTSYVMMSLLVMFEATGDVAYLRQLTWIADGVLAQRDSERGVTDYRGESNPCWQATGYGEDVPYCWTVHSGMIAYPMAELAVLIGRRPELAMVAAWDDAILGEKAERYLEAATEVAALHSADWRNDGDSRGYYLAASDATFTGIAGQPLPLNMMNAMGRLHLSLYDATGDDVHHERARRLGNYLWSFTSSTPQGGYAWNYRPAAYSPPGEDISHAAINVGFVARAAQSGIVFNDDHLRRYGNTGFDQVYVDTRTTYDRVGGSGSTNGGGYRAQFGRWLVLDAVDVRLHAAVRATLSPHSTTGSGSLLLGFALLAATDHVQLPHRFYHVDWEDLGDRKRATARNANILIQPPDPSARYLVPVRYRTSRRTLVQQWDGDAYHTVAKLAPTAGEIVTEYIPYDPAIYFDYDDGVLYQFNDAFVEGAGIEVWYAEPGEAPSITSTPAVTIEPGATFVYEPSATGERPMVWTAELPDPRVSFDAASGRIELSPEIPGPHAFTLRAHNDWGVAEQTWALEVVAPAADAGTPNASDGGADGGVSRPPAAAGCACRGSGPGSPSQAAWLGLLAVVLVLRRRLRRRAPAARRG